VRILIEYLQTDMSQPTFEELQNGHQEEYHSNKLFDTRPVLIKTKNGEAMIPCDNKGVEMILNFDSSKYRYKEDGTRELKMDDEEVCDAMMEMFQVVQRVRKTRVKDFINKQLNTRQFVKDGLASMSAPEHERNPIRLHCLLLYSFFVALTVFEKDKAVEIWDKIKEHNYTLMETAEDGVGDQVFSEGRYLEFANLLMGLATNIEEVMKYADECDLWKDGKNYLGDKDDEDI